MARYTMSKAPSWIGPVTIVALVLGFLLTSAWKDPRNGKVNWLYGNRPAEAAPNVSGNPVDEREKEMKRLRDQITELQQAMTTNSRQAKLLNENLQDAKLLAGLTEVRGPGIEIILRDSKKRSTDPQIINEYNIHDRDVITVVNDLWLSGAEAISINGQRLGRNTGIRCEGAVIYIGRVPTSSPVRISAIGDIETLYGALTMQGRYLDMVKRADPAMVEVTKKDKLVLPAYSGSTEMRFAKSTAPKS